LIDFRKKSLAVKRKSKIIALILVAAMVAAGTGALTGCGRISGGGEGALAGRALPVAGPIIDGVEAYHVIVASGEPEGVAAAVAAARNGLRTLLVEEGDALGGLFTLGMLNFLDMNHGPGHVLLTRGIFEEFYVAMGNAFDVYEAKDWFMELCEAEPNLTVLLNTEIVGPVMDGNTIIGLEIREQGSEEPRIVRSLAVIDSTVDADVAAAAGVPYTVGGEDFGAFGLKQGVTLVFEVSGVDWDAVSDHFRNDGNPHTGVTENAAWGFVREALNYVSVDGNMRFRGPNIAKLRNGNVLLNALIIFGVDALCAESRAEGIERGRQEIPHIIEFMRGYFIGFENAEFVGHAPRLYVRETRHIIGEYRVTITDLLENRDFWDSIGHGSYPVDLQPTGPHDFGVIIGYPDIYSVPFRALVPLYIDGLLVASRSASYDSLAHGSLRVVPIGMVAAQAAGTAAAYIVENGGTFRDMTQNPESIRWLQDTLRSQGAKIVEIDVPNPDVMYHWAYPGMSVMRKLGMARGGYENYYRLDEDVSDSRMLQDKTNRLMGVVHVWTEYREGFQVPVWEVNLDTDDVPVSLLMITAAKGASLGDRGWLEASEAASGYQISPMEFANGDEAADYLIRRGVLSTDMLHHFPDMDAIATQGQLHSILGALFTVLMDE